MLLMANAAFVLAGLPATGPALEHTVYATVAAGNGTSPPFLCAGTAAARLTYRPVSSRTSRLQVTAMQHDVLLSRTASTRARWLCRVIGIDAKGEYIVRTGLSEHGTNGELPAGGNGVGNTVKLVKRMGSGSGVGTMSMSTAVIKGLSLHEPVRNSGNKTIFTESWATPNRADSDATADAWLVPPAWCNVTAAGGALFLRSSAAAPLGVWCGLRGRPHQSTTFNLFRHPLTLAVHGIRARPGVSVCVSLEVPTATEMASTGWPVARHYLPLADPDAIGASPSAPSSPAGKAENRTSIDGVPAAALSALILANSTVQLRRRRVSGLAEEVLAAARLPPACGWGKAGLGYAGPRGGLSLKLFAGSSRTWCVTSAFG